MFACDFFKPWWSRSNFFDLEPLIFSFAVIIVLACDFLYASGVVLVGFVVDSLTPHHYHVLMLVAFSGIIIVLVREAHAITNTL